MRFWHLHLGRGPQPARHGDLMGGLRRSAVLALCALFCLISVDAFGTWPKGGLAPQGGAVPIKTLEGSWMIGDSLSAPFHLTGVLPGVDVEYEIGMSLRLLNEYRAVRHDGQDMRVEEKIARKNPTALYLWLGSNGIDRNPAEAILADYETLLRTIRGQFPDLPIYIISATPVRQKAQQRYPRYTPEKILEFNAGLLALCEEFGAWYVDFYSILADGEGFLDERHSAFDGIHMSYHTYEILRDFLLEHWVSNAEE